MMSMANPITIGVETPRIDSGYSLQKDFTEMMHMNPRMVLYLNVNHVNSYHSCVHNLFTRDIKDIL